MSDAVDATQRPGADWLDPRATRDVRRVPIRRRVRVAVVSLLLFAVGFSLWRATAGNDEGRFAPLSFRLVEQRPEDTGLVFHHRLGHFAPFFDNVMPLMQAVSAAACASDVDRDGLVDVFMVNAGSGEKNRLFRNVSTPGKLRFAAWSIPSIEDLNGDDGFSSDCVFADIDNDGDQDLYIGAISQAPKLFVQEPAVDGTPRFVDVSAAAGLPAHMNGFAASFFDLENDGDLDLLFASYFGEKYRAEDIPDEPLIQSAHLPAHENAGRMLPNDWGNATNGGPKHLLRNDGRGHFTEVDAASLGLTDTRFTFDIGTADVDQDGFTDVYFANDFGPDQLFFNRGGTRFEPMVGVFPTDIGRDPFKGMNADFGDIDHDGFPEIYVTNVHHPVLPEGNLLWHNRPDPAQAGRRVFQNIAADVGVKNGGWGWGAKFVDIDLDADVDLIATNGYISQHPDKEYWFRLSRLVAGNKHFIVDTKQWPPFEDRSMSGHQTSHVFVNEGARFWNRAADVGVTRSFDGRGVVIADFDVDGRPDVLFVAQGQPYALMHNEFVATERQASAPAWVGLLVEGDGLTVNRDAVGVRLTVTPSEASPAAPRPLHREISAGNGMSSQSSSWVVAGLGRYQGAVDVTLRWTDGAVETRKGLSPNRYHTLRRGLSTRAPSPETP